MDDDSFDRFLGIFKGVLPDLGVTEEKMGERMKVVEGACAQVHSR